MMATDADEREDGVDVPRSPEAYRPAIHFGERFHDRYDDRNRHLDDEIVATCIREGDVDVKNGEAAHFHATFGGATYRLVVDLEKNEVVTGYPVGINTEVAAESGRWSSEQIDDIREFIATKGED